MIRKTITLLGVLTLLLVSFTFARGNAFASAPKFDVPFTAPVDFAAVQKICPHVSIHLNGAQHTLTCLKSQGAQPNLSRGPCGFQNIDISNYNNTGELCFNGGGYLGVNIYQVNSVYNAAGQGYALPMWMKYYHPSGVFCSLYAYNSKNFGNGNTNVEVTQLDWGTSGGYGHC